VGPDDVGVVVPPVVDVVDLRRIGVDAALGVAQHRAVLPAALEQLVEHLHVLLGALVTGVVLGQTPVPEVARGVLQVGGDDVPRHAPVGQVIQG
jgi:hypothetical protein